MGSEPREHLSFEQKAEKARVAGLGRVQVNRGKERPRGVQWRRAYGHAEDVCLYAKMRNPWTILSPRMI